MIHLKKQGGFVEMTVVETGVTTTLTPASADLIYRITGDESLIIPVDTGNLRFVEVNGEIYYFPEVRPREIVIK